MPPESDVVIDRPPARTIAAVITVAWNGFFAFINLVGLCIGFSFAGLWVLFMLFFGALGVRGSAEELGEIAWGFASIMLVLLVSGGLHLAGAAAGAALWRHPTPAWAWRAALATNVASVLLVLTAPLATLLPLPPDLSLLLWMALTGHALGLLVPGVAVALLLTKSGRSELAPAGAMATPSAALPGPRGETRTARAFVQAGILLVGLGAFNLVELLLLVLGIYSAFPVDLGLPWGPIVPSDATGAWLYVGGLGLLAVVQGSRLAAGVGLVQRRPRAWASRLAFASLALSLVTSALSFAVVRLAEQDRLPRDAEMVAVSFYMGSDGSVGVLLTVVALAILVRTRVNLEAPTKGPT